MTREEYIDKLSSRIYDVMCGAPDMVWEAIVEGRTGLDEMDNKELVEFGKDCWEMEGEIDEPSVADLTEDIIADFMLKRIENGNLVLEDIPVRLARYGMMDPREFESEMTERMRLEGEPDETRSKYRLGTV